MTDLLHVGNVGAETTEQQLHDLFAPFGRVTAARVMRDAETQTPRGFGLVEMATHEAAQAAAAFLMGRDLHGRPLAIRFLPPRASGWEGGSDQGGSNRSHGLGMGNGGSRW